MTDKVERVRTIKEKIYCPTEMAVAFVEDVLPAYMLHIRNNRHQKAALRNLKTELTETDVIVHTENYSCKNGREILETHFGCNRPPQITLHTGVLYNASEKQSFWTVTPDSNHDPVGILRHLKPVLEPYYDKIENRRLVSDSPSTQYRNRHMLSLIHI